MEYVADDPRLNELDKQLIAYGMTPQRDDFWREYHDRLERLSGFGYVVAQQLSVGGAFYSGLTDGLGSSMGRKLRAEGYGS